MKTNVSSPIQIDVINRTAPVMRISFPPYWSWIDCQYALTYRLKLPEGSWRSIERLNGSKSEAWFAEVEL